MSFSTTGSVVGSSINASFNSNTLGSLITTGGNVGIGTTSPAYTLDVNGTSRFTSVINTFPVHLSLYGNQMNTQGGTSTYYYFTLPSMGSSSQNFTSASLSSFLANNNAANNYGLYMPYTGIWSIKMTIAGSITFSAFISKNTTGTGDLNGNGENLLSYADIAAGTISATTYLQTSDYIRFGAYTGTSSFATYGRCTITATLLQRTV